jgi:hypothetical protein
MQVRKLIKISSKQLVFSLALSLFIGAYLYLFNSKKVSIEYFIERDKLITLNSCASVNSGFSSILQKEEIGIMIRSNHKHKLVNGITSLNYDENFIRLKIKGFLNGLNDYDRFVMGITQELREVGSKKFVTLYSSSKVHCNGVDLPAFNYINNFDVINREQNLRYGLLHHFFLAVSPLITLYLFFVALNYIKYHFDE